MTKFIECKKKITIKDIEAVEKYVNLTFPTAYKKHLLKYNGGQPEASIFFFFENGKEVDSEIDRFLAIYDGKYDNLKNEIDTLKINEKRLPQQMLPIANDVVGNCICISCKGKDSGKVYFWDHEKEVDYNSSDDNDYSNLYFIADTFEEFLDRLKPYDQAQ